MAAALERQKRSYSPWVLHRVWRLVWIFWICVGLLLLMGPLAAALVRFQGRTPPSSFLEDTFGSEALVFNQLYEGRGSSEDRTRTVVLVTEGAPQEVLRRIAGRGGWKSLSDSAIDRPSDGLCVVAYSASDYDTNHRGAEAAQVVARAGEDSVVLSLLFC